MVVLKDLLYAQIGILLNFNLDRIIYFSYNQSVFSFQSGKTTFIKRLLKSRELLFNPVPQRVIYIYSTMNSMIDNLLEEGLIHKAVKTLPNTFEAMEKLVSPFYSQGVFLILDDAVSQLTNSNFLPKLFEEFSHHKNCSIMFVSQSTFLDSSSYRRLSDNSHSLFA